jgi:hypothetical protein
VKPRIVFFFSSKYNTFLCFTDLDPREQSGNDDEKRTITTNPDTPEAKRASCDSEYYEDMITRINEQLTNAVESGQSPYAIYGMVEDDENEWC